MKGAAHFKRSGINTSHGRAMPSLESSRLLVSTPPSEHPVAQLGQVLVQFWPATRCQLVKVALQGEKNGDKS